MTAHSCAKRHSCSAPYCPLDPDRSNTTTLEGEASCLWLREAVKPNGKVPEELAAPVQKSLRMVLVGDTEGNREGGNALRKVLKRAAERGSSRSRAVTF